MMEKETPEVCVTKKEVKWKMVLSSVLTALVAMTIFLFFNTAQPLENTQSQSQQVIIGAEELPKININTASRRQLMMLDGVGDTLADRIIENRPYGNVYEIADIEGVGEQTAHTLIQRIEV